MNIIIKKITLLTICTCLISTLIPTQLVHAAYPGRNGKLALSEVVIDGDDRYYNLHDINLDGTNRRNLITKSMSGELVSLQMPSYSADGSKLVYSSVDPESSAVNVYLANADGSGAVKLTNYSNFSTSAVAPKLDPTGTKIIYTEYNYNGNVLESSVKSINIDGSNKQQLGLTGTQQCDSFPVYSPDGSKIAFSRKSSTDSDYNGGIYIASSDGTNVQKIADTHDTSDPPCNVLSYISFPSLDWSPDGNRIVFADSQTSFDGVTLNSAIKTVDINTDEILSLKSFFFYNDFSDVGDFLKAVQYSPSGQVVFSILELTDTNIIGKARVGLINQNGQNETYIPNLENPFNDETTFFMAAYVNYNYLSIQPIPYVSSSTFVNQQNSKIVNIQAPEGTDITCARGIEPSSILSKDSFKYPLGLVEFCFDTKNLNNQVSLTFETDLKPDQVVARKYNSDTGTYANIEGASITETKIQDKHALQLSYIIKDNGDLDQDSSIGSIKDPVGLALKATLADTGANYTLYILISLIGIAGPALFLNRRLS